MDQDEIWHAGKPWPGPYCVRWGPSCCHGKGHSNPHFEIYGHCARWELSYPMERGTSAPTFWPMSIVAKRSSISATAEFFFIGPLPAFPENLCKSVCNFCSKLLTDKQTIKQQQKHNLLVIAVIRTLLCCVVLCMAVVHHDTHNRTYIRGSYRSYV